MKHLLVLCLSLTALGSFAQLDSIWVGDMYRYYAIHLPPNYDGVAELPVVIGLHGGFGSAEQLPNQSLLSESADEEGYIALYPDGLGYILAPAFHFWNAGECCGYPLSAGIDDVQFISDLIDDIGNNYAVDLNRVYATGISNGGMMSYKLACELSDKIAAIAPVAGPLMSHPCNAENPIPVIHFQSYQDSNIPYLGGVGDGASDHYNPPIDSVLNVFASLNDCASLNDTVYDGTDFTHVVWSECLCSYRVEYFISTDGGHSWPGGVVALGDDPSVLLDANDLMWEFFQEFSLDCNVTVKEEEQMNAFEVFPNPASNIIHIISPSPVTEVILYNQQGSQVATTVMNNNLAVDHLPVGLYVMIIKTQKYQCVRRILKEW
jgi:polyhydroxybutyrate depolymerase